MTHKPRRRLFSHRSSRIIGALVVLVWSVGLALALAVGKSHFAYSAGLHHLHHGRLMASMAFGLLAVSMAAVTTGATVVYVLAVWRAATGPERSVYISISILIAITLWFGTVGYKPGFIPFTRGLHDWAQQHVLVTDIRRWAASLNQSPREIVDSSTWPPTVAALQPSWGVYEAPDTVRLAWGSGFGHWGIVVGPVGTQNLVFPGGEYTVTLDPGSYVWHEKQGGR